MSRKRRAEIVKFVKNGGTVHEATTEFDVSMALVYQACGEAGVTPKRSVKAPKPRTYMMLRQLWEGMSVSKVALVNNVSLSLVSRLKKEAAENGWPELKE